MEQKQNHNKHQYPFRILDLDKECQERIKAHFLGRPSGLKSFNHWGFKLAATTSLEEIEQAYNHPLDFQDIWLVTPPKCGTTWTQEMVWLIANDLDYEGSKRPLLGPNGRWNFIDFNCAVDKQFLQRYETTDHGNAMAYIAKSMAGNANTTSPRFIKTHLPLSMNNPDLLDVCKVVYVARNPKDACISYYYHCRMMKTQEYTKDIEAFVQDFMDGNIAGCPFVEHMIEAWNLRHHPNMCMLFFEDMKRDMPSQIRKVAEFLGKSYNDEQVEKLAEFLKFENLKRHREREGKRGESMQFDFNENQNPIMHNDKGSFFRSGKIGDWKNHFTPEMNEKFDQWLQEKLKGKALKFIEELDYQG